jgi:hypothetical protein
MKRLLNFQRNASHESMTAPWSIPGGESAPTDIAGESAPTLRLATPIGGETPIP